MSKRQHQHQPLIRITAVIALILSTLICCGCVYPTYDGDVGKLEEQQSVWQYLKVYSIFHNRLPKTPGSMTPYDMFRAINDSLGGGRYTEYIDDRPGGGVMFDPNTEFEDPIELAPSTVYIGIPEFSDTALWVFKRGLRTLSRYSNIIIDVRYNGGGLLSVTDEILGEMLPKNTPYIKNRYRMYNSDKYRGEDAEDISRTSMNPTLRNKKIAVLMNRGSASASEILAAGLKDAADAYLVGSKSYGKGIGQVIITRGGGRKRLSITFLEISGLSERTGRYHKTGLEPDPVPDWAASYVDAHIPNARQREGIRIIVEEAIEKILAKNPNADESYIQEYRQELTEEYENWFREPYYALKQLDPGYVFPDDGGDGEEGEDIDDNNGGADGKMSKQRAAAVLKGAKGIDKIAMRIHSAKARWRPMGAVIIDEKDLPKIQLSDD
jgi:hypothetical protein